MNKQEFNEEVLKIKSQQKKETQKLPRENTSFEVDLDDLEKKIKTGQIPEEIGKEYLKNCKKEKQKYKEWKMFIKQNPDLSQTELIEKFHKIPRILTYEETIESYNKILNSSQIYNILLSLQPNQTDNPNKLFKNVNARKNFGIAKIMANTMYNLFKHLPNLEVVEHETRENVWTIKAEMIDSYKNRISLEHEIQANSLEEAIMKKIEFMKFLKSIGLKTWLCHWAAANDAGDTEFSDSLSNIMKYSSSEDRKNKFKQSERQAFWDAMRTLSKTIFKIESPAKKRKNQKQTTLWTEQPLITILGGEIELDEKYPTRVSVKLLNKGISKKAYAPSVYSRNTPKEYPNNTTLAFMLETRLNQRGKSSEIVAFDWESAFVLGNLEQTAKTNRREAKSKINRKLKNFKKKEIIAKSTTDKVGIKVTGKNKY